jgi:hypothetical protein
MKKQTAPIADTTEDQLRALIAECHQIIREDVLPHAAKVQDDTDRRFYMNSVIELVRIAATVGDTIGRLRAGGAIEQRQRITVERVQSLPALPACPTPQGEGG